MVIFMPYYRQHGQLFHSHARTRPSASSTNGQNNNNTTMAVPMSGCKFASSILCRFTFSLFLLIIALFLFQLSTDNISNQKEGSNIIAAILLTIAIVSFVRTCQTLRRYYIIMHTRRRLIQRLREQQHAYDLALSANNIESSDLVTSDNTDLPLYKELFPSHLNISNSDNDPPSYDDFVKTRVIRHSATTLPIPFSRSHALSLPNTSLSSPPQSQSNSPQCIWTTDRTRRPVCIRGTVTYV